jgi:inositol transport system substrate-binding protein
MKLNKLLSATALTVLMAGGASAETIGYSSPNFDDNFQTILRAAAVVHIR